MQFLSDVFNNALSIATPYYLYMNEAIWTIVQKDNSKKLLDSLNANKKLRSLIESCSFPKNEKPEDRLYRLSQSTTYHGRIAIYTEDLPKVLDRLQKHSDIPFVKDQPEADYTQIRGQFDDLRTFDLSRVLNQIEFSMACYSNFSKLKEPDDQLIRSMDRVQPLLHLIIGGLITFKSLETCLANRPDSKSELADAVKKWMKIADAIFLRSEEVLSWMQSQHGKTKNGKSRSGKQKPKNQLTLTEELVLPLEAIHLGLQRFSDDFNRRNGLYGPALYTRVNTIIENHSQPLLSMLEGNQA